VNSPLDERPSLEADAPASGPRGAARPPAPGRPPQAHPAPAQTAGAPRGRRAGGRRVSDELWTCRRLVDLIRQEFDVRYRPDHVGSAPARVASARNDPSREAKSVMINAFASGFVSIGPRKKLRRLGAHLICLYGTGFLMMPVLRRIWARCGHTPLLAVRARLHEKVSGIGAVIVSPQRRRVSLALALYSRCNIRGLQVLRFLRPLARHVRGLFILVWDRGPSHKHQVVQAWLAAHRRCHIVWFPPYAPDLNPVELLWGYLKYGGLANATPDTVDDI
jgi:DDE superfamily endonuclease